MKILLATFGSRGDVQPMLALSLVLQAAGHDVLLAGPPEKAEWAARWGCPYRPLGSNVTALIDSVDRAYSFGSALTFMRFLRKDIKRQFAELPSIIRGADMAVGASLCFGLSSVAEANGIPYRYIAFTPQLLPSRHHPFLVFKRQRLPGWCNMLGWKGTRSADRINLTLLLNAHRRKLGLKPVKDCWAHVLGPRVIVASDRAVASIPPDSGMDAVQTGYMHLPQPGAELKALDEFLAEGPPAVYAGFGSMPKSDQTRLAPLIVSAARMNGMRAVITRFWEDGTGNGTSEKTFFIRRYPHWQLFPRMAAVIHHGGAGTTATAAACGVPQIIVPHVLDQYYWGERVCRARIGPRPIWRSRLTAKKLAAAISQCVSDPGIRRAAGAVSEKIRRENGAKMTVEELLKGV
ncbi:MAG: glycosyltransferase family 1 protein [Deltaproteobacteria bacterium]|nr:glycosyltransferase family 1 protein [Deltaproteobacteria bacterium]MBW1818969.1 glycosyltransferase family 1 protein [Deltaproteobacteria bacterium]MBW2285781.1 glycosyltransferase family 1 protein [Deltaproteobacteria bacterium]